MASKRTVTALGLSGGVTACYEANRFASRSNKRALSLITVPMNTPIVGYGVACADKLEDLDLTRMVRITRSLDDSDLSTAQPKATHRAPGRGTRTGAIGHGRVGIPTDTTASPVVVLAGGAASGRLGVTTGVTDVWYIGSCSVALRDT